MAKAKKKRREQALGAELPARIGRTASSLPPMRHTIARTPATTWPVKECWVSADWNTEGALPQIAVVRMDPVSGAVAAATFLVDLGCLGVKNADVKRFTSYEVFEATLFAILDELQPMEPIDLNSAAKIVREGLAYADSLGFTPHRDFLPASVYLAGADPDAADIEVPLGVDGKPYFINGPYDNVDQVMAQLDRVVGKGNYHYTIGSGPPGW